MPKSPDPSYKMDLDLCDCLGRMMDLDLCVFLERVKLKKQQNFIGLIYLFVVILERGKPSLIME